ncbi:MAG: RDD family protein [Desulfatiglans sp.]|jgi:uncharacterized RDD family membrane protein YckC|nr:RDD family protein [Thermodesulfobacteriota bacterium]MEE4354563.1 RDD family protein [Desulfatiglans sp.]
MQWYYAEDNQPVGPIGQGEFQELVQADKIRSGTLVWNSSLSGWQEYDKIIAHAPVETPTTAEGVIPGQSTCAECGQAFAMEEMIHYGDAWVCSVCKPAFVQKIQEGMNVGSAMAYAGFWIRFGAKFIDWIILSVVNMILTIPIGFLTAFYMSKQPPEVADMAVFLVIQFGLMFLQMAVSAAYSTWLIGRYGATLGKMACRIRVVCSDGGRVTYWRAFGRHFAEILSAMTLLIGYIIAGFDEEKRALHDRICNTRVVKK